VNVRPGAALALSKLSAAFELFIFTSSSKAYADQVIDLVAPFIPAENRFYHDSCDFLGGYAVKDLRRLHRSIHSVVLIDDMLGCGLLQPMNTVGVAPWVGDPGDSLLASVLVPLLLGVRNSDQSFAAAVRNAIKNEAPNGLAVLNDFDQAARESRCI
jgi:TFIIF-interacting CTD phosphatase-like protein